MGPERTLYQGSQSLFDPIEIPYMWEMDPAAATTFPTSSLQGN